MKKNRYVLWGALAVALIGLVTLGLVSCGPGLPGATTTGGAIKLVGAFDGARSIYPQNFALDAAEFRLVSAAGDPSAIDQVFPLTGGVTPSINVGVYHLTVFARNSAHENLGEQSETLVVEYGKVAELHVVVNEYVGPGTATGTLTWEPDILPSGLPTFDITMVKTSDSSSYFMPFTLSEATCSGSGGPVSMPAGWYSAAGVLKDVYGKVSTGFAAAVRIAQDHNTDMALALHALPTSGGGGFTFTWNGIGDLQITGTPAPGDMQVFGTAMVPMAITSPESGYTVTWYLDGVAIGTGANFNLDPSLMLIEDTYRLDAIAISADLQRAASLTWTVAKGLNAPNTMRIEGEGSTAGMNDTWHAIFQLRKVETPTVIYASVTTYCGAGNSMFQFLNLPVGGYILSLDIIGHGEYGTRWWNDQGGGETPSTITIPTVPNARFNF